MGKVLKKYPRESFILADKSPIYKMKEYGDVRKIFDEQLNKKSPLSKKNLSDLKFSIKLSEKK